MPELAPVRLVAVSNVSPLEGAPIIDATQTAHGDEVLLAGQEVWAENGIWVVNEAGGWSRRPDFDSEAEMVFASEVVIKEGEARRFSRWRFVTDGVSQVDTTPLEWRMTDPGFAFRAGSQLEELSGTFSLTETGVAPGTYSGLDVDIYGRIESAVQPDVATTHVEGLGLVWDSANSLTVRAGSAFVPGLGKVVELQQDYPLAGLSLFASSWYYLYLYEEAGEPEIEVSLEAPDEPYLGTARTKGAAIGEPDDTRRYIGTFNTHPTTANTILPFRKQDNFHWHLAQWDLAVGSGGLRVANIARVPATATLEVDLSPLVPPHVNTIEVQGRAIYISGGTAVFLRHSGSATFQRYLGVVTASNTSPSFTTRAELDASRRLLVETGSANAADLEMACTGFWEDR